MQYTLDEFFRLQTAIEEAGGEHLDATHDPVYHTEFVGPHIKGHEVIYCGADALFLVPYDNGVPGDDTNYLEACAVDDRMGLWPRYAHANAAGQD